MPGAVLKEATRELDRLSKMPVAAAEYTVSRTYLDWLVSLPWTQRTEEMIDLKRTKEMLDADHSDLEKAKDRILEYLAVRKLNPDVKGPILCFVGPPGVGKTSLARSIATSIGRKFVRVSLGGMRDEAEIRGHRRTYIGALPGTDRPGPAPRRVAQPGLHPRRDRQARRRLPRRSGLGAARGARPGAEQRFRDHYLDVPFDLSEVLFITTANVLDPVPPALRDRMEVLELPGYTEEEKLKIAREHLIGKQVKNHGLTRRAGDVHRRSRPRGDSQLHARGGRPQPRARDRRALPQGRAAARRRQRRRGRDHASTRSTELLGAPQVPRRGDRGAHGQAGRRDRPGLDAGGRRSAVRRGDEDAGRRAR